MTTNERRIHVATYVISLNWTDQGIKSVRETVDRSRQANTAMEAFGIRLQTILWTTGHHDLVVIAEAPDDETLSAGLLTLASQGALRTEVARAFTEQEMEQIIQKMG